MYEVLLNNGAWKNASLRKEVHLSPLMFSFQIGDISLTRDLIKRGCKINTGEISLLGDLYVDYAISDSKWLYSMNNNNKFNSIKSMNDTLSDYYQIRMHNKEILMDFVHKGLENGIVFEYDIGTGIAPMSPTWTNSQTTLFSPTGTMLADREESVSAESRGNDLEEMKNFHAKLEVLFCVIFCCDLHRKQMIDIHKNTPLHKYLYHPITATNVHNNKRNVELQQICIVKLLKFECRDWLYQSLAKKKISFLCFCSFLVFGVCLFLYFFGFGQSFSTKNKKICKNAV